MTCSTQELHASKASVAASLTVSVLFLQVSELGLDIINVEVVRGEPVSDGCIPLRWKLSERDVLTCKLEGSSDTSTSTSLSLTACPDEIQKYLEQVAQCTSIRRVAIGEVKAVPESSDNLQVRDSILLPALAFKSLVMIAGAVGACSAMPGVDHRPLEFLTCASVRGRGIVFRHYCRTLRAALGKMFVMVPSRHSNDVDVLSSLLDCAFGGFPLTFLFGCITI